jgi:hypothetical protein
MDIANQVDSIVEGLVRQIQVKLDAQVETIVTNKIQQAISAINFEQKLNWLASVKLDNLIAELEIDKDSVDRKIDSVTDIVIKNIENEARTLATNLVQQRLYSGLDLKNIVREAAADEIHRVLQDFTFPARSIPVLALQSEDLTVSGDQIKGGVIEKFSSTGIDDRSSQVQMTVMDQGVVIENRLISMGLEVKGTTVFDGDVVINGDIPEHSAIYKKILDHTVIKTREELNQELFEGYSSVLFDNIRREGLDLDKITIEGKEIIKGNQLGYSISDSNIQRLGLLQDLRVGGEADIFETLHVTKGRIGVNTRDPSTVFSVWDQEVELGMGKRERDVAFIGTPRGQRLVVGSGKNDNLILDSDGTVKVKSIDVDGIKFMSVDSAPNFAAPVGVIAWNRKPAPGASIGWVSLGNAVWSKFGILS